MPPDDSGIYFELAGSGRPLVLIHGNMLDSRMWDLNFHQLAGHFTVLRYDMRGFGRSGSASLATGSVVGDLAGLLDYLNIDSTSICGSSLGGVAAMNFCLEHPDRIDSLILADSDLSGFPISAELADAILQTHHALSDGDIDKAVDIWLNHPMLAPARRLPAVDSLLQSMVRDYSWRDWLGGRAFLLDRAAIGRLGEIVASTLVLTGREDMPRFAAIAETLCRDIANSRRLVIPGAGHLPNMERPDVFNEAVIDFLAC